MQHASYKLIEFSTLKSLDGDLFEPFWKDEPVINAVFLGKLKELEGIIDARNADCNLKNRNGAGVMPCELLKPFSEPGITGKGVPYSISI
uniref:Lipoxygenase domain-containing protein n=1 Tax=Solanum lycopersicum TaxID=4081 RepID=A0A3Q7E9U9_SOLLC